jgi:hypothetical protein
MYDVPIVNGEYFFAGFAFFAALRERSLIFKSERE